MREVRLEILFEEDENRDGSYKIFTFKEIEEFPKEVDMEGNLAVMIFSGVDKEDFKESTQDVSNNDFKFIKEGSMDGKYIRVSEFLLGYMKKNRESIYLYDPCGEMNEKWNVLKYKKK